MCRRGGLRRALECGAHLRKIETLRPIGTTEPHGCDDEAAANVSVERRDRDAERDGELLLRQKLRRGRAEPVTEPLENDLGDAFGDGADERFERPKVMQPRK